jgi:hypothetical protein
MMSLLKDVQELLDLVLDQAATINLLKNCVGELELGHGVLMLMFCFSQSCDSIM